MLCIEFNPYTCSSETRGTLCSSSNTGYIALTVQSNTGICSFQYTVYVDRWNSNLQQWDQVWSQNGVAQKNHSYTTTGSTFRTFRTRINVWASGDTHIGASFQHKG